MGRPSALPAPATVSRFEVPLVTGKLRFMNVELINTGTELLLGFVTNTNQQWLCRRLSEAGFTVTRQVAVADTAGAIQAAVAEGLARAEIVITTGGLGPTSDDLTRQCIAELFGRALHEDPATIARIEAYFKQRNRPVVASTRVQALVPEGATLLPNSNGTAPGLALEATPRGEGNEEQGAEGEGPGKLLIMLPGPPRELKPMFTEQVLPLLQARFPDRPAFVCRTLKSTGIGESMVETQIAGPLQRLVEAGLEIGYCARFGEVDVRLVGHGEQAETLVTEAEATVRSLLSKHIFGADDEQLHEVIIRMLTERKETLAVAESCTGGFLANRLTNVPGASAVFPGGWITYSNQAKQSCLGVRAETLAAHGAVSEATAREMAEGARRGLNATYALAVTGIAGPSGGTPDKPVGTVWIALAGGGPTVALRQVNRHDRESFKFVTSQQSLELLRRRLT
jgi:nicotinamide-nucleotide amidase